MERIISAVICGELGVLLYIKLLADGKKKYFKVNIDLFDLPSEYEITAEDYNQSIEKHKHIIFYVKNKVKYRALLVEGLDIPWEPLFNLFLFEKNTEKIFKKIVGLTDKVEHHELFDIEKIFYSYPGLYKTISNKLELWREDNTLSPTAVTKVKHICLERGYIKLLNIIQNLQANFV